MFQSATTLARSLRDGEITSEELVEAYLLRIDKINPAVNAVVALADDAIELARQADSRLAGGQVDGPLHGVPMTIKDCFDTAGVVSTWGPLGRKGGSGLTPASPIHVRILNPGVSSNQPIVQQAQCRSLV